MGGLFSVVPPERYFTDCDHGFTIIAKAFWVKTPVRTAASGFAQIKRSSAFELFIVHTFLGLLIYVKVACIIFLQLHSEHLA